MKCGGVSCPKCGYKFYFETEMESVRCLQCGEKFDISSYPDKVEIIDVQVVDESLEDEKYGIIRDALV